MRALVLIVISFGGIVGGLWGGTAALAAENATVGLLSIMCLTPLSGLGLLASVFYAGRLSARYSFSLSRVDRTTGAVQRSRQVSPSPRRRVDDILNGA